MKALVTAGGRGTRLRPITNTINKHLIPIAGRPMLFYALDHLASVGVKEVGINMNIGEKELQPAIGDGKRWGVKITYREQTGGALGVAHILKVWKDWLGLSPFIFYLGDNIVLGGVDKLVEKFEKEKLDVLLALSKVGDPQRFGVPEIKKGKIVRVDEKPSKPASNFAVTGLYIYNNKVFEAVEKIKPSARGEFEISDVHTYLIKKGHKVGYEEITGWWKDTGKPEDLLEGNQLVLSQKAKIQNSKVIAGNAKIGKDVVTQGMVEIGKGTKISGGSMIRGPVVIGENCVIENSYIAPFTSIGNSVEIYGAEIEHSIIMDNVDINCSTRIVDSIIGSNVLITPKTKTYPSGHKLIVGENSSVEL
jgi:glucose-1-phosphate thymidylyltransferase